MPACVERRIIVLGSTGSIGVQTLEVVEHLNVLADRGESPVRYRVVGLAGGRNQDRLNEQAARLGVHDLALAEASSSTTRAGSGRVRRGATAAESLVREVECDIVLGAMVGSAGLPATLAAVEMGRDVALANKETLVAAGSLVIPAARRSGARLLPVDSEHCALWQCLLGSDVDRGRAVAGTESHALACPPMTTCSKTVSRVVLTASGGPFRTKSREETYHATPEQALKHPTWNMGPKVTVDCASLTNKALEVIEAHWLFGLPGSKIEVLVHPQSMVHAMAEFADGSVIAQIGPPDMRSPIQYALTFPHRPEGVSRKLDWSALSRLEFGPPDRERFPALDCAYEVIERGGTAGAVFNAANEAAVELFLGGGEHGSTRERGRSTPFGMITELARRALREIGVSPLNSLADAMAADAEARRFVTRCVSR